MQVRRWIPIHADLAWSMPLRFPVQSRSTRASRAFHARPQIARFPVFHAKPRPACFRTFHAKLRPAGFRPFASRANAASVRVRLCRNLTDTSFLSVPLCAHLSGVRSITINPVSAVHSWYFSSISGRNRESFYQKYFYGISVLADILGIKPYFHKKNTRNRYQINSYW